MKNDWQALRLVLIGVLGLALMNMFTFTNLVSATVSNSQQALMVAPVLPSDNHVGKGFLMMYLLYSYDLIMLHYYLIFYYIYDCS